MFPVLDYVIALSPSPRHFAQGLAVCLEPLFDGLYETLMEQLTAEPGAVGFIETWIRVLQEQTARARKRADASCEEPL